MCKVLEVSRSSYYRWLQYKARTESKHLALDILILKEYEISDKTYGSPRISIALKKKDINISESTISRHMKKMRIAARYKRRFKNTTDSNHNLAIAPNLLDRKFDVENISEYWVGDITYIRMNQSWLYLTTVIDLADRMVIGWSLSDNMTTKDTVVKAFNKAIRTRIPRENCMFHSDRGVQYASEEFKEKLKANGCIQSMSRKGNCWDNAVAESFFKTIKIECIYNHVIKNEMQAYSIIFEYIDGWYNTLRIHSALGGLSPLEALKQKLLYIAAA